NPASLNDCEARDFPSGAASAPAVPNAVIVSILTTQRREEEKIMNTKPGIIGKKLGMTHLYKEDGTVMRVTVVDTSDVLVVGKRTPEKDGYNALILGMKDAKEKHLT